MDGASACRTAILRAVPSRLTLVEVGEAMSFDDQAGASRTTGVVKRAWQR